MSMIGDHIEIGRLNAALAASEQRNRELQARLADSDRKARIVHTNVKCYLLGRFADLPDEARTACVERAMKAIFPTPAQPAAGEEM